MSKIVKIFKMCRCKSSCNEKKEEKKKELEILKQKMDMLEFKLDFLRNRMFSHQSRSHPTRLYQ